VLKVSAYLDVNGRTGVSRKAASWWSGRDRRRANAVVGIAGLIIVVVLILFGVQLHAAQSSSRQGVVSRFQDRAQVISALTQAILASAGSSSSATRQYGAATVSGRLLDRAVAQGNLAYAALIDHGGNVIAASRTLTTRARANVLSSSALESALAGAPVALSDVHGGGPGGAGVIDLAVSMKTPVGGRVLVSGLPTSLLSPFLTSYLKRVPTPGGTAYVLDSRGNTVGARDPRQAVGGQVTGLSGAVLRSSTGSYGRDGYFAAVAVPSSTWRVVLTSSESSLFHTVSGSRKWLPWGIYLTLGIVALGFLALLRRVLGSAVALSTANDRLAGSNARLESSNAVLRHAAELARSNAELEQFASIASHDLQEPLRKVQTFAAHLTVREHERLSAEGQDFLRRMSEAAGRMRALIDDLLLYSRVSTEARPFVPVDLGEIVSRVLVDLEVSIEESGARVTIGTLPTLEADPVQMGQLMQNLLANALKFRRREVVPQVDVEAHVADGTAELTVRDNGLGFEPQYASRIFRAFERLHGASAYPGTGIGLALCRKIVERHHGTIAAESEVDSGATFTIRLPIEQPAAGARPTSLFPLTHDDEVPHALA
jgi:signal transduction histidine kinase